MQPNYWTRLTAPRTVSRRRLLKMGAASMSAAAILAACGGSATKGTGGGGSSSLVAKPIDTSSKARRGGVMTISAIADPTDFDGLANASTTGGRTIWV